MVCPIGLVNRNAKILSSCGLFNLEKYLQEVVALGFEYSSDFVFNYSFSDCKLEPVSLCGVGGGDVGRNLKIFMSLLKFYLYQDCIFSSFNVFVDLGFKINYNQFVQIFKNRGLTGFKKGGDMYFLGNLFCGVSLRDFIFSLFSVRKSIMEGSFSTADSGYLTRRLVESLRDLYVKEACCGSKCRLYDPYRVVCIVSPWFCWGNKSVCCRCVGISFSRFNVCGYNKGIISGQAIGEPSTQMLLKTFHLGTSPVLCSLRGEDDACSKGKFSSFECFSVFNSSLTSSYFSGFSFVGFSVPFGRFFVGGGCLSSFSRFGFGGGRCFFYGFVLSFLWLRFWGVISVFSHIGCFRFKSSGYPTDRCVLL